MTDCIAIYETGSFYCLHRLHVTYYVACLVIFWGNSFCKGICLIYIFPISINNAFQDDFSLHKQLLFKMNDFNAARTLVSCPVTCNLECYHFNKLFFASKNMYTNSVLTVWIGKKLHRYCLKSNILFTNSFWKECSCIESRL